MRALSVAARAVIAGGVIVLGASCRPDRLTAPGADGTDGAPIVDLGSAWGSSKIDVTPDVDTLPLGSSRQFSLDIGPSRHVTAAVRWLSLDSSVVTINGAGVATARNGGRARIVGKLGAGADTATMVVMVPVAAVVASPESGELTVGQHSQLTASANDILGRPIPGVPVEWTSVDPSVASVSASGVVTGISVGAAKIVARTAGKSDTTAVRVSGIPVAAIAVSPTTLALSAGATGQLTASASSATGAALAGRLTTWTSSDESVARISATGAVTAVGAGTATIRATIDGRSATSTVTVTAASVASIAVSANATSLTVGQTTQASATVRDASGAALSGHSVTWTTSDASVATVSPSGTVTAAGPGTVTITGTSGGVNGSVTITVTQTAVATVSVSVNAATVAAGQTTQASAAAFDASGQPLAGRTVTWTIAPATVATVSSSGTVTGVGAGTATLTATVDGRSASTTITVTTAAPAVPPSDGSLAVTPELPRAVVASSVAATPSPGATIRVPSGGDLQSAIDHAQAGDVILLAAGGSYTGNFVLRAKSGASGSAWVTIRTETMLPAEGTRTTPATAAAFAKILTPNASPAIATDPAAGYYRISGVEIAPGATSPLAYSLVALGDAGPAQSSIASVPHHLILDRTYIHASAAFNLRRCVALNSAWTAVVDSWLADCHSNDGDSQAIWGSNGPGPLTIVNNHLEGAGENVMFGGADSRASELLPSDITFRRNHLVKPAAWQHVWSAKNLFELKVGRRVLVEGNVLEGSWIDAQIGFAMVIKSTNQEGGAPWSTTQDVTVRFNRIARSAAGISISGHPEVYPVSSPTARVLIEQNLIEPLGDPALGGTGRLFITTDEPRDVVLRHNTGFGTTAGVIFANLTQQGFVFNDNVLSGGEYNWSFSSADGHGVGVDALDYHAPGWKAAGNLFVSGGVNPRPAANYFVATMGEAGFVDAGGSLGTSFTPGNYRLSASSPYKGKGTDGTDPGVDHDRLNAALAGAIVP